MRCGRNIQKLYFKNVGKLFLVIFLAISSPVMADYTIQSGTTIDASTIQSQSGVLTINGTLKISSNVSLSNFTRVVINSPNGNIYWSNNSDLTFSAGTNITIDPNSPGLQPTTGKGNSSQRLIVGSTIIAVSSDNSNVATFSFEEFNVQGGLPDFKLTSNNSVCSGSSITAIISPVHTVNGVTYSYQWMILPNSGSFQYNSNNTVATITPVAGTYTITCTAKANSYIVTKTIIVKVKESNTWLGASSDWSDAANWCPTVPTSTTDVTIPATTDNPIISSSTTALVHNLTIESGGGLQILGRIKVSGSISNSGTLDITNGTLEMNGTVGQTIAGSLFQNKTINNLVVNNSNSSGLSLSSTLNDTLKVSEALTFGNPTAKLNTSDNLNLLSTSSGTARLGILARGNTITGKVIVDRYVNVGTSGSQHSKSWQFLATPTNGQTIKQSWMEDSRSMTGYGIYLTSPNGTSGGFDAYSPGDAIKYYDPSSNKWIGLSSANNQLYNSAGYMVFIRGDRTVDGSVITKAAPTILRSKGNLLTGTQPPISILPNHYQSIGNPYASPVDFSLLVKSNIDNLYYAWDPYLYGSYGYGGYQTISGTNNWKPVPGGSSAYSSSVVSKNIQSGQAFFVHSSSNSAGSITFNENSKASTNSVNFARHMKREFSSERQFMRASLYTSSNPDAPIADGNAVAFDSGFSDQVDSDDGLKIANSGENFGIIRSGKFLAVEARPMIISNDTIFYKISNLRKQTYQLRFEPENMEMDNSKVFLLDQFLNTETSVSLKDTTLINIDVTSNSKSSASDRFMLVFRQMNVLPVKITSFTAVKKGEAVELNWNVQNESGLQNYRLERSDNGISFSPIAIIPALNAGQNNYEWTDGSAHSGDNFYRLAGLDKDGKITYSSVVKVLMGNPNQTFTVFPNPVKNGIVHVQFFNQSKGKYLLQLFNSLGEMVFSKELTISGTNNTETFVCKQCSRGIYQIEIRKPNGSYETLKIFNR